MQINPLFATLLSTFTKQTIFAVLGEERKSLHVKIHFAPYPAEHTAVPGDSSHGVTVLLRQPSCLLYEGPALDSPHRVHVSGIISYTA